MLGRRGRLRAVSLPRFVAVAVTAVLALLGGATTATAARPDGQPVGLPTGQPADQPATQPTPHAASPDEHPVVTVAASLGTTDLSTVPAAALAEPARLAPPVQVGTAADHAPTRAQIGSVSTQRNRAPPAAGLPTS